MSLFLLIFREIFLMVWVELNVWLRFLILSLVIVGSFVFRFLVFGLKSGC